MPTWADDTVTGVPTVDRQQDHDAATAVVVGRYAGAVGVLAEMLAVGGVDVVGTAAVDAGGVGAVATLLAAAAPRAVVVMTVAPGDPVLPLLHDIAPQTAVVAVTWHPADELPDVPRGATVVVAGAIRRTLADAVRDRAAATVRDRAAATDRGGAPGH